ncbi:4-hydroxy-tetrahydrodipicolinate synthase [Billgrantia sp. C5P2]|uniref:4-hydroxy-tetrahydrodipicolinate synthase n=1 Tax=Billgrantia sp. C5P2 TaxID=3436239 RepID=UPI003DA2EFB3
MKLEGILPALVTPFDDNDRVNHQVLADLVEHQLKLGSSGFVPLGSTGESYALTNEERREVLKTVREVVGNRGLLIAGANAPSTREVIEQVKQNRDAGYDAVLIAPPFYSVPSEEELLGHYRAILEAVPDVEVVLYNYPMRVAIELGYGVLDGLQDDPRVIAIKESSGELMRAIDIGTKYKGKIDLCCGSDDIALDFFVWGATSWISAPANIMPENIIKFYDEFKAGNLEGAKSISEKIFPVMNSLETSKFIQKIKYGCELSGFPVGKARMPLQPLSEAEKAEFRKAYELV